MKQLDFFYIIITIQIHIIWVTSFFKDPTVKYIFLCYLFLSSVCISAQSGEDRLEKLMQDNFKMSATPENILTARKNGESVLHVIYREVVKAPNSQEISTLAEAKDEIPEEILYKLQLQVDLEGHSLEHFIIKIAKENVHSHAIDKLDTFCGYVDRYKNIRRPRTPCEGCTWQRRGVWAAATALGTAITILAIAYKYDFTPISISLNTGNNNP